MVAALPRSGLLGPEMPRPFSPRRALDWGAHHLAVTDPAGAGIRPSCAMSVKMSR